MQLQEVRTPADEQLFLRLPDLLYKNDPNWIKPLDKDILEVFDAEKNKFIKRGGEHVRWLLRDGNNALIGRVAAFVNKTYKQAQPTGGMGFFECIDNQEAAFLLFDACKQWLAARGMEAMDGPINFGERDKWWGLLTEGFDSPLYCMNYNPPYYKALFEAYGFKLYFNQICFGMKVNHKVPDKVFHRHKAISEDPNYRVEHIRKGQLDKYARDFNYVYNKAWAGHGGGKTLEEKHSLKMFQTMKAVIDEHITWFTYYKDEPIAIWINLPDLNHYFKHLNGKFGLLQKLRFLWLKQFGNCGRFVGLVFGVIPEFQGKGVDSYMIIEAAKMIQRENKYQDYEMQWIGDFNPKMVNMAEGLCGNRTRNLVTYRYMFDKNAPYERHPMLRY